MASRKRTLAEINKFFEGSKPTLRQQRALMKKLTKKQRSTLAYGIVRLLKLMNDDSRVLILPEGSTKPVPKKGRKGGRRAIPLIKVPTGECAECPDSSASGGALVGCDRFRNDDGDIEITCYYVPPGFWGWLWSFGWGLVHF